MAVCPQLSYFETCASSLSDRVFPASDFVLPPSPRLSLYFFHPLDEEPRGGSWTQSESNLDRHCPSSLRGLPAHHSESPHIPSFPTTSKKPPSATFPAA